MKDPIQKCHEYLRTHPCLVVIDGLQSTKEWDLINAALGLGTNRENAVVVITSEESVAKYCAKASDRVWNVKGLGADHAFEIIAKVRLLTGSLHSTVLVPSIYIPLNFINEMPKRYLTSYAQVFLVYVAACTH